MLTLETLIENLKKVKEIDSYIKKNKKQFPNCAIIDDMPFEIEDCHSYGTGLLAILNYHLNQESLDIEPEVLEFINEFEDNELSIEYDWNADGHFEGSYWPGDYYQPAEYPEWEFDKFNLSEVRVVNANNETVFVIPQKYHNLIESLVNVYEISEHLEEYESEHYDDYDYDDNRD